MAPKSHPPSSSREKSRSNWPKALEQLPEEQRLAVQMQYLGQLPLQQISPEMERSVSSVAELIPRGVQARQAHRPTELGELT